MKIGDKVKVTKKDVARYGEIGTIIGRENTILGLMWRVRFDDKDGLYSFMDLQVV